MANKAVVFVQYSPEEPVLELEFSDEVTSDYGIKYSDYSNMITLCDYSCESRESICASWPFFSFKGVYFYDQDEEDNS